MWSVPGLVQWRAGNFIVGRWEGYFTQGLGNYKLGTGDSGGA